jgi:hypothetical protein
MCNFYSKFCRPTAANLQYYLSHFGSTKSRTPLLSLNYHSHIWEFLSIMTSVLRINSSVLSRIDSHLVFLSKLFSCIAILLFCILPTPVAGSLGSFLLGLLLTQSARSIEILGFRLKLMVLGHCSDICCSAFGHGLEG